MPGAQLQRFWFRTAEGFGIGVPAPSEPQARCLAGDAAYCLCLNFEVLEVIPDIDARTPHQDHVVPNMGPSSVRRVWFSRLDL